MRDLIIQRRFNGPSGTGNGGYTCGLLAGRLGLPAEVTLRVPPPLDEPLRVEKVEPDCLRLMVDDLVVAEACSTVLELGGLPSPPTLEEATSASTKFAGFATHPFTSCFVCGIDRDLRDGLRIFPGPLPGGPVLAAPWMPDRGLANPRGTVADEFVWAALDCPAGWAISHPDSVVVLGRMAAVVRLPVEADRDFVITAWPLGRNGRKCQAAAALFSSDGELHAMARSTWIEIGRVEGSVSASVRDFA